MSFGAAIQGGVQAGAEAIAGLGQLVIDGGIEINSNTIEFVYKNVSKYLI